MKKGLLAVACAFMLGMSAYAQAEQEVVFVEDPSQGYLFNRFKDNWFIQAQGGGNVFLSPGDSHRDLIDRFEPAAGIYVGKWFSPILGMRIGGEFLKTKGLSEVADAPGVQPGTGMVDGYYKQRFIHLGPSFDVMLSLINWWGGYSPTRVYDLQLYAGGGWYYTLTRDYNRNGHHYHNCKDNVLEVRAGLINTFHVSKHFDVYLDMRFTALDNHRDEPDLRWNKTSYDLAAYLGVAYRFNRTQWYPPVVPVCPEPENCDPLRQRLADAEAKIADLDAQLKACLERPVEVVKEEAPAPKAPLATIYFPINVSKLTPEDVRVVNAVAEVMKNNPDTKYVVTGWADNYTGNDRINTNLRKNRAASVERQLLNAGVPAGQFTTTINAGNLVDLGEKFVALDRATTIQEAE
ncbi:MAG: OmpA family protein [Muribaculaceae bacterium]|nr:OmpA family protein [Muribaculaceae bacterium]MDE5967715.1 OmpA family protein [Muribaculaceae bacterium]MDE7393981.1 OmpA family protein [Muribaculaceae bacterium]